MPPDSLICKSFFFLLQTMMLNDRIQSLRGLQSSLRKAEEYLLSVPQDTPYSEFNHR